MICHEGGVEVAHALSVVARYMGMPCLATGSAGSLLVVIFWEVPNFLQFSMDKMPLNGSKKGVENVKDISK